MQPCCSMKRMGRTPHLSYGLDKRHECTRFCIQSQFKSDQLRPSPLNHAETSDGLVGDWAGGASSSRFFRGGLSSGKSEVVADRWRKDAGSICVLFGS